MHFSPLRNLTVSCGLKDNFTTASRIAKLLLILLEVKSSCDELESLILHNQRRYPRNLRKVNNFVQKLQFEFPRLLAKIPERFFVCRPSPVGKPDKHNCCARHAAPSHF